MLGCGYMLVSATLGRVLAILQAELLPLMCGSSRQNSLEKKKKSPFQQYVNYVATTIQQNMFFKGQSIIYYSTIKLFAV